MVEKKSSSPIPSSIKPQPMSLDINTGFTKLVGNTATIAQHVAALKLVAKGVDVEPIEEANMENQNLLVALASFINRKGGLPGQSTNRAQRRKAERQAKKIVKKQKNKNA